MAVDVPFVGVAVCDRFKSVVVDDALLLRPVAAAAAEAALLDEETGLAENCSLERCECE